MIVTTNDLHGAKTASSGAPSTSVRMSRTILRDLLLNQSTLAMSVVMQVRIRELLRDRCGHTEDAAYRMHQVFHR
jgi:hypothetical protein